MCTYSAATQTHAFSNIFVKTKHFAKLFDRPGWLASDLWPSLFDQPCWLASDLWPSLFDRPGWLRSHLWPSLFYQPGWLRSHLWPSLFDRRGCCPTQAGRWEWCWAREEKHTLKKNMKTRQAWQITRQRKLFTCFFLATSRPLQG